MGESEDKPATLKTIAELTGLSLSTVSLSLRGGANLKKETREKVAKAARDVGYVPNRAGVRLRTGRTNVLALLLAADENVLDFTRLVIQGIGSHISGTRFHLNVVPEFHSADPVAAVRYILETKSADGVILTHTRANDPRIEMLIDADFPFVSYGRTDTAQSHAYYDFDVELFLELAVERMATKEREQIVLAAVNNGTKNYAMIVDGFNTAVAASGLNGRVAEQSDRLDTADGARSFAHSLVESASAWGGIICNNELTALSIIGGLQEKGVVLGRDYDLICKQNTEILPTLYPHMDTVAENLFESGNALAELLISRIQSEPIGELQRLQKPVARWKD